MTLPYRRATGGLPGQVHSGGARRQGLVAALILSGLLWPPTLAGQRTALCEVPPGIASARPDAPGTPTDITIGLWVNDLRTIDDARQLYDADLVLSLSWTDPRLASESFAGCSVPVSSVWSPRPVFRNERAVAKSFAEAATIGADGRVAYVQRYNGGFTSPLRLRDFPFDDQVLEASVVMRGLAPEELQFSIDDRTAVAESLSISDWEVGQLGVDYAPLKLGRNVRVAQVNFRLPVVRNRAYYVQKIFLPLFLIVVMSWAVFWIDPDVMPAQIGISTSAVLTLIAFLFSLGQLLPRLSYLTRADRFVMGATVLVFVAFGEALLTTGLASRNRKPAALRIDRVARLVAPLLFAGVLLYAFVL